MPVRGDDFYVGSICSLSAVFAALTSILAKIGIDGVNSNLATAIRIHGGRAMAWGMVFLTHCTEWDHGDQQEVLAVFDLIRSGNRCILAVLLQGFADGRGI